MNSKKVAIMIGAIVIVFVAILFAVRAFLRLGYSGLKPNSPKNDYGEFPVRLVYELNGEICTVSDIVVCEFDGLDVPSSAGWFRKWKVRMMRGDGIPSTDSEYDDSVRITLLDLRNRDIYDDCGNEVLELYFYGGNGHYYMGDELGNLGRDAQDFSEIDYLYKTEGGMVGHSVIDAEDAYEKYKIRLIGWEAAEPMTNAFDS